MKRLLCVLLICVTAVLGITYAADADENTAAYSEEDYSRVYSYEYFTTNCKVGKQFAGKRKEALAYFVKYGMKKRVQAIETFDVNSYYYGCPDLRKKFGTDFKEYYLHFQKKGYKKAAYKKMAVGVTEMQEPVTTYGKIEMKAIYDYHYYIEKYPFVLKEVGDDDGLVLKNFVEVGMKQKRVGRDPLLHKNADPSSTVYKKLRKKIKTTNAFDGAGLIVCIDPGHQLRGDYSTEPVGPGSSSTKAKVTSGAYGSYSGKNEYEINLEVSLLLRDELEARGYRVVMTRTTHNVSLSNIQRTEIANSAGADIFVRIHCNDIDGASSMNGVFCYAAASNNPYLKKKVISEGQRLAVLLRDAQAAATGQNVISNLYQNDMTGINWAKMPTCILEMGFMSNPTEDRNLANTKFQKKIVKGLANGIDKFFMERT